jgi:hypothetical protein
MQRFRREQGSRSRLCQDFHNAQTGLLRRYCHIGKAIGATSESGFMEGGDHRIYL